MADGNVSGFTQAILASAGLSVAIVVLWVLSLIFRGIASVLGIGRASSEPKPAKRSNAKAAPAAAAASGSGAAAAGGSGAAAAAAAAGKKKADLKTLIRESQAARKTKHARDDTWALEHPLLLGSLPGHTDIVNSVAWSANGRALVTACDDQALRIFDTHDVAAAKDAKCRTVRTEPETPVAAGFGNAPGDVAAVLRGVDFARLALYGAAKSPAGQVVFERRWAAPKALDDEEMLDGAIVPASQTGAGGVAVLLTPRKFGRVLDLATGRRLAEFQPNSLGNNALTVSANGRFFAVAAFTADVKIWENEWARDGSFKGAARALELKGHARRVASAAISPDGARAATASDDGTLRVWRLDVRYKVGEDARTVLSVPLASLKLPSPEAPVRLAWGPDGTLAAVSRGGHVTFVDAENGKLLGHAHAHDGDVTCAAWSLTPLELGGGARGAVLATGGVDGRVRLWRSPKA